MRSLRNSAARQMGSVPKAFTVVMIAAALGVSACSSGSTGASGAYGDGYGASSGATSSGAGYGSSGSTGYGSSGYGSSSGNGSSGYGSSGYGSSSSGSASASTGKGGLLKAELTSAGKLLANPHGMTIYYYTQDRPGSGVSSCTGGCATAWPPILSPVRVPAGIKLPGPLGVIVRPGGIRQVTINGYPLYRYAGDKTPGEATGNGLEGEWHVIKI